MTSDFADRKKQYKAMLENINILPQHFNEITAIIIKDLF